MNALSGNPGIDIREAIDTPKENDDTISACDKLLTSLADAEKNAENMLIHLRNMKSDSNKPFTLTPDFVRVLFSFLQIICQKNREGLTILLTSHFMDEVEALCDRIMILKNGKSVFCGTVQEAVAASPYDKFEDAYL